MVNTRTNENNCVYLYLDANVDDTAAINTRECNKYQLMLSFALVKDVMEMGT